MNTEYVYFEQMSLSATGKTKVISVMKINSRITLGIIKWHGPWRKYTFHTFDNMTFDSKCLQEIINELDRLNKEHKELAE